jgi:hypothetical protein
LLDAFFVREEGMRKKDDEQDESNHDHGENRKRGEFLRDRIFICKKAT